MCPSPQLGKLLFAAFLSVTLFLLPALLPGIGLIGCFCPLPIIGIYLSCGAYSGRQTLAAALLLALVSAALLFGVSLGISYLYQMGLAAGMGEAISRSKGREAMLTWGIALGGLVNLGLIVGTAWYYGQGPVEFWSGYWRQIFALLRESAPGLAALPDTAQDQLLQIVLALGPGLLLIISSLACWLNLWGANRLARRLWPEARWGYASLTAWRAPEFVVWVFIAAALLFWLSEGLLSWLALNLLLLSGMLYWFQGMAVANWWADKKGLPTWGRVAILTVSVFLPFLLLAVALVGLFDVWFNWRGLKLPHEQPGGLQ